MFKILTFNQIATKGLEQFSRDKYEVASEIGTPDAILLRSHKLQKDDIGASVKAIARAGAGVNNIPVDYCTNAGIPVFNTPGANANAVKELVMAGLLLSSRGIFDGMNYVRSLKDMTDGEEMSRLLEKEKKRFSGNEIAGKTLGVVGLGAIGSLVAEMGLTLGMEVLGYDPALSVEAAWRLSNEVKKIDNLTTLLSKADYITLHLPVLDSTRHLINRDSLGYVKKNARLLNFAREEIVQTEAVTEALDTGRLKYYITDFPAPALVARDDVILMPHIGASTDEAEENCAVMAARELTDFLENGNIVNSVNFPKLVLERSSGYRIAISNKNIPKMLGSVTAVLADHNINVIDLLNKSRGDIAYNLIDIESDPSDEVLSRLRSIQGVINVRSVKRV